MGPEWVAIIALIALFVIGTVLPINMGALAYAAAWLVGMFSMNLSEKEILNGISADLVLTLIGVTYLFAIARQNGTVDLIVRRAVASVGGRVALIPWVMFGVTALMTAIGAASPAACAIVGPIALGFAARYRINPLMMGMFVVHGAQAGGFSPISIFGTVTNSVMRRAGFADAPLLIFFASLAINAALAVVLFVLLGGRRLVTLRIDRTGELVLTGGGAAAAASGTASAVRDRSGRADRHSGTGAGPTVGVPADEDHPGTTREHVLTLLAFAAVAVVALGFDKNIGFTAITAAVLLSILNPGSYKDTVKQIAWPTVLLVAGVSTYATVLTTAGSPEFIGNWAAGLGAVAIGALILCYVGGIVSAFASSTALLPVIIPIAIPLVVQGGLSPGLFVAALAISSTIVDVSPFSTNGALILANRPDTVDERTFYRQILTYATVITLLGPLLVWAALVLPGVIA
ncbi:SLC13 family permease [Enemella evansiae]|uniref:SLC13 family permease n=1 Tax=Enemella evansiae TaxID=2016499 RepID=UPI0010612391|nr:SLC13 family permease [Enemella evansiae]TDO93075.1 UIT1 family transporter [Enemella evansiae]